MNSRKVKVKISWGAKIRHSRKLNFNFSLRKVVWRATTRWTSKTFVMLMTENWHSLFQPRNNNKRHYLSYKRERTNSCLGSNNKTEQIRMTLWWPTSYQTQTHCSAGLFFFVWFCYPKNNDNEEIPWQRQTYKIATAERLQGKWIWTTIKLIGRSSFSSKDGNWPSALQNASIVDYSLENCHGLISRTPRSSDQSSKP